MSTQRTSRGSGERKWSVPKASGEDLNTRKLSGELIWSTLETSGETLSTQKLAWEQIERSENFQRTFGARAKLPEQKVLPSERI